MYARVHAYTYTRGTRFILVPLPWFSAGILKSSSCLTKKLILIHTEEARSDGLRSSGSFAAENVRREGN